MKFKFIYTIFSLCLLAFITMSHEAGRADDKGQGNTGAPGDEAPGGNPRTCVNCHNNNAAIQTSLEIEVLEGDNAITEYEPGQTYRVKVSHVIAQGDPQGYGFQILCLKAPEGTDGEDVAGFSNPADNVKIAIASSNGRQYAEQDGESETSTFEMDWTAPESGSGAVTFYSCGNAVNSDNMNTGDAAACQTLQLGEKDPSSIGEVNGGVSIYLFPNPVQEEMKVRLVSDVSAKFAMEIFDMQGRVILKESMAFNTGENDFFYDVSQLSKGTYLVKFSNDEKIATAKLLKL